MPKEIFQPNTTAVDAIASAMMLTQIWLLQLNENNRRANKFELEQFKLQDPLENPWDMLYHQKTQGMCDVSSLLAATVLQKKYSYLFRNIFLVKTYSNSQYPFRHPNLEYANPVPWYHHVYAVTEDSNGIWRAFSPANRPLSNDAIEKTGDPMTKILDSSSLEQLLACMESDSGGNWPKATDIEQTLQKGYQPASAEWDKIIPGKALLSAPCLTQEGDKYLVETGFDRPFYFNIDEREIFADKLGLL